VVYFARRGWGKTLSGAMKPNAHVNFGRVREMVVKYEDRIATAGAAGRFQIRVLSLIS
jgi:hypothetical protein